MNRFQRSLTVLFLVGGLACGLTPAQDVTLAQAACMDVEAAASVIPPGSIQQAADDLALVCTDVPIASIIAFLTDLFAKQADAGIAAATGPYVPSPHVLAAHAARVKAFGDGK
jgi:hypothetical protein